MELPTDEKIQTLFLPTQENTLNELYIIENNIDAALAHISYLSNYYVANRELALVKTKLQEAKHWFNEVSVHRMEPKKLPLTNNPVS